MMEKVRQRCKNKSKQLLALCTGSDVPVPRPPSSAVLRSTAAVPSWGNKTQTMVNKALAPPPRHPFHSTQTEALGHFRLSSPWSGRSLCPGTFPPVERAVHRRANLPETNEATDSVRCYAESLRLNYTTVPACPNSQQLPWHGASCATWHATQARRGLHEREGRATKVASPRPPSSSRDAKTTAQTTKL